MDVLVEVLTRGIGVYNMAYAVAIVLYLTPLATVKPARLAGRYVVALAVTCVLGKISDAVFPNSITWTVLPATTCALLFRDSTPPTRLVRAMLLMCAWMYSLTAAEVANSMIQGGTVVAALVSLAYMLVVLGVILFMEHDAAVDDSAVSFKLVVPVLVVCASGLAARAILYLRSDFGPRDYYVGTLESVLTCATGQVAELVAYAGVLSLAREFVEKTRLMAEQHLMQGRLEALRAYRESGESYRILRHEVKNQYAYIKMLLEKGDYDGAKEFFGEMSMRANPTFMRVSSGNDLVDDIVNIELSKAIAAGVEITSRIAVPTELPFEEIDLCGLLMNLLDNAIEACEELSPAERTVRLGIVADQGTLMISVANPAANAPQLTDAGKLATTKTDAAQHGYGTGIVRRIADKYDGLADFSFAEGEFTAKVMLAIQ